MTRRLPAPACDVVVVGAGPAGIAAAIHLTWLGRQVQVIDKAPVGRDKCCGDGLTTLALRELERLQVCPEAVRSWHDLSGAILRSPAGREVPLPLPTGSRYGAVAPRAELDAALVRHARSIGVEVFDRVTFTGLDEHEDDRVAITAATEGGETTIECRYVVAADGAWSAVRKATDTQVAEYRGDWHAFRQYANNVTGRARSQMFIWFEPDLLPGYAWSFPLPDDRANIGFGILLDGSRPTSAMAGMWRDLLTRPHIRNALGEGFELEGRHLAWPIPARIDGVELAQRRVLFVGDAAAATDVLTGEGIGQALLTGRLAAHAIDAAGGARADRARAAYRSAVTAELVADHRMSKRLSKIMATERGAENAIAIVAASGAWGRRNFARWLFEDEPRAITLTPRRWHRRFLARPGAYAS